MAENPHGSMLRGMKIGLSTGATGLPVGILMMVCILGCDQEKAEPVAVPPTTVTVSQPVVQEVSDFVEFTGNTQPLASVDLRARVKGFLKKTNFTDGAMVKQGELLFEIDPAIFQAQVDSAKASLQAAKATLEKANADLAIKKEMEAGNAASKLEVIQAQASVYVAQANVELTTAQLEEANINLGYTKIYAPISGRIDKAQVDVGNLVGADGNTLLANIVQLSPIYAYFNADEATVQKFQKRIIARGILPGDREPNLPMTMALGLSDNFSFKGVIDYVDNKVDPSTGTINVRAVLPNDNRALLAGYFVRVRVPDGEPYQAVLVPERAIGVDQGQKYLLAVNDKNVVELRPIETGSQHGRMRVVTKGITADDWIITEGLLRTRPGATVAPEKKALAASDTGRAAESPTTQPAS